MGGPAHQSHWPLRGTRAAALQCHTRKDSELLRGAAPRERGSIRGAPLTASHCSVRTPAHPVQFLGVGPGAPVALGMGIRNLVKAAQSPGTLTSTCPRHPAACWGGADKPARRPVTSHSTFCSLAELGCALEAAWASRLRDDPRLHGHGFRLGAAACSDICLLCCTRPRLLFTDLRCLTDWI